MEKTHFLRVRPRNEPWDSFQVGFKLGHLKESFKGAFQSIFALIRADILC